MNSNDTVFVHQTFTVPGLGFNTIIAASPDGRKITTNAVDLGNGHVGNCILNFDKSTGNITSYTNIDEGLPVTYYDAGTIACFSPNSRFLYTTDICCNQLYGNTGNIYQLDLYTANPWASKRPIYNFVRSGNNEGPAIRMHYGPDKKIYAVHFFSPGNSVPGYRLGIINYPDILENGSNSTGYNNNGPDIVPPNCPYPGYSAIAIDGIPDRPEAYDCNWQPGVPHAFGYFANACLAYQFNSDKCWNAVWYFGDAASGLSDTSSLSEPVHNFSGPGNYIVTCLTNGYTFKDTIRIAAPAVQIASTPILCPLPYANYSIANIQPFVNYIWTVTNGIPATAQGQISINVNWNTMDTSGMIMVVAIDTVQGCSDTTVLQVNYSLVDSGNCLTSIEDIASDDLLSLYPNPASTKLYITSPQKRDYELILRDITGRLVQQRHFTQTAILDVADLARGVYLADIFDRKGTHTAMKMVVLQ